MAKVNLTINGRHVLADEGEMLLAVCRREGFDIPALCDHAAVEPFGACRLCIVEITKDAWDGWKNYVTACLYPVEQDLIVLTHSPKVLEMRTTLMDMQLARCPESTVIREMAAEYGITKTSYEQVPEPDDCILCGLCTRICDRMGFHAISTVGRGHGKEIAPPLRKAPPDCVGCLSCAENCPTGFIKSEDKGKYRTIWGKKFEMQPCKECGAMTVTKEFAAWLSENKGIPMEYFETCAACHRKELSKTMGKIVNWEREAQS